MQTGSMERNHIREWALVGLVIAMVVMLGAVWLKQLDVCDRPTWVLSKNVAVSCDIDDVLRHVDKGPRTGIGFTLVAKVVSEGGGLTEYFVSDKVFGSEAREIALLSGASVGWVSAKDFVRSPVESPVEYEDAKFPSGKVPIWIWHPSEFGVDDKAAPIGSLAIWKYTPALLK